jgi:hypothetical protein
MKEKLPLASNLLGRVTTDPTPSRRTAEVLGFTSFNPTYRLAWGLQYRPNSWPWARWCLGRANSRMAHFLTKI